MEISKKMNNPYGEDNPNLYHNGTPFLELEDEDQFLIKAIKEVEGKKPCIIVIGGGQSSAKTTLAIHKADRINILTGKPIIDLKEIDNPQYTQGSKNFMRKLNEARANGCKVLIWDETASDYRRKRAISNINKTLDEAMQMIRIFKIIIILVYHDFSEIPTELIRQKAIVALFQNDERDVEKNYVVTKAYNYGKMCIIKNNLKTSIIPEYAFSIEPNYHLHFKDLSPERSRALERLSSNIKHAIFDKAEISLQGYLSQEDLSIKLEMSKAWVRKIIKQLNIQPEKKLLKVTYYNPKVLEELRRKIKRKSNI